MKFLFLIKTTDSESSNNFKLINNNSDGWNLEYTNSQSAIFAVILNLDYEISQN